jgi:hypothetical protein
MEEEWEEHPTSPPTLDGILHVQKPSGKFVLRQCALCENFLYIFGETASPRSDRPLSRICLQALTVTNSSDQPLGFNLVSSTTGYKTRFLAISVDDKRQWVTAVHSAISSSTTTSVLQRVASVRRMTLRPGPTLDRSAAAQCQGQLEKRQGFGAYKPRWCEMRSGAGLAYSKYQSSSDDAFKIIPLNPFNLRVSQDKLRFSLVSPNGTEVFFRCKSEGEFQKWTSALQAEIAALTSGSGDARAGAAVERRSLRSDGAESSRSFDDRVSLTSPTADFPPDADSGNSGSLDAETMRELIDLGSDVPIAAPLRSHSLEAGMSEIPSLAPVMLESISSSYHPTKDTPGIQSEVNRYLETCVTYGLPAMVARLHERMLLPIVSPFEAVEKHITILSLDMDHLRTALSELMARYGQEACIRDVVLTVDRTLRIYRHVRERLLVRKNIAAFREQKDQKKLPHGVNGTLHFISLLIKHERGAPSVENWNRVRQLVVALIERLEDFRLEFDVYDESLRTVLDMEQTIQDAHDWLVVHESIAR